MHSQGASASGRSGEGPSRPRLGVGLGAGVRAGAGAQGTGAGNLSGIVAGAVAGTAAGAWGKPGAATRTGT